MVEFSGDDFRYVTDRIKKLQAKLQGMPGLLATLPAIEASQRQPMWNLRNAAVPLYVVDRLPHQVWIILEPADPDVAAGTEEIPHLSRDVVVVNVQGTLAGRTTT